MFLFIFVILLWLPLCSDPAGHLVISGPLSKICWHPPHMVHSAHCSSHLQQSADTYFGGEGPSDGIALNFANLGGVTLVVLTTQYGQHRDPD